MKKLTILLFVIASCMYASAQRIKIEKSRSQLYISHHVKAKETLYSLGRVYHITPKEIAIANKLKADAGLQLGQVLKVPLTKSNFVQLTPKNKRGMQPVYHTIAKGENLTKLSSSYNKVKPELLKSWNNIKGNAIKPGQDIIVGYVRKSPEPMIAKKPEPVKEPQPKVEATPVANRAPTTTDTYTKPLDNQFIQTSHYNTSSFFEEDYAVNAATKEWTTTSGTGSIFKSTSGWSDNRYYLLIANVPPETVFRVTVNGRTIYAKALEALPEMPHNRGLLCRLSSAAASALGINSSKFTVELSYYK